MLSRARSVHPGPQLFFTLPEFFIPIIDKGGNIQVCNEEADHVLYRHPTCGNMQRVRRETIPNALELTVKLNMMTAVGKVRINFRGDVLG